MLSEIEFLGTLFDKNGTFENTPYMQDGMVLRNQKLLSLNLKTR